MNCTLVYYFKKNCQGFLDRTEKTQAGLHQVRVLIFHNFLEQIPYNSITQLLDVQNAYHI